MMKGKHILITGGSSGIGFLLSDVSACISGEIIVCDQARYVSTW